MNIFVLHRHPRTAARDHCDKHVVKMTMEYAQMLSTAHRVLDGTLVLASDSEARVRPRKFRLLGGESLRVEAVTRNDGSIHHKWRIRDAKAYAATHANHPCAVWARATRANYEWLHELWVSLMAEYTHRYGKRHAAMEYLTRLSTLPDNLPVGPLTEFPQAMPPQYQVPNDPVAAYHRFYVGSKSRFAKWTNTDAPQWFQDGITIKEGKYDASRFERTR